MTHPFVQQRVEYPFWVKSILDPMLLMTILDPLLQQSRFPGLVISFGDQFSQLRHWQQRTFQICQFVQVQRPQYPHFHH